MTFGEKLRDARKKAGISQEELAEKLSVSRSAVAKWETDNGLPDVGNLKVLAAVLNVSIDYLLAEDERLTFNEIRKPIDLANYQKAGKCRSKKDAAVYGEYRDADAIWPLIRRKKLNRGEFLLDSKSRRSSSLMTPSTVISMRRFFSLSRALRVASISRVIWERSLTLTSGT